MSLQIRLMLLIFLLFIALFVVSSYYIIASARNAVQTEVESTARLAVQLIQIATASSTFEDEADNLKLLESLASIDEIRHLHIEIQDPRNPDALDNIDVKKSIAPTWFFKLVEPPPTVMQRWLYNPAIPPAGLVVRADPTDEIDENWILARNTLLFLLSFIILANLLMYITIAKYLAPVDTILLGLSGIEQGNYKLALPSFRSPELDRISQRINQMAEVLLKSQIENQLLAKIIGHTGRRTTILSARIT